MNPRRAAAWGAVLIALALVFAAYLQRDFIFTMASEAWSCL